MRVLHFCEAFSLLSETFIYDCYVAQVQSQLDAHMATVRRVDEARRPAARVHVLRLPGRTHPFRIITQIRGRVQGLRAWERPFPVYARGLRAALKQLKPDVLHAHFGTAGVIAEEAVRGLSVPLMVTMYGHDLSRLPREAHWRARYRKLFDRAALVTVLSEDMRALAHLAGVPPERVERVHLARSFAGLSFQQRSGGVRSWVSIGRLTEKKGFDDTIQAVARLRERGIRVELQIIGEGPLLPTLRQLVERLGLSEEVRFAGALPNHETLAALARADAFVLSSKTAANGDQEGTPTVLVEAQALGLPCVSTRHAGIPEMFPEASQWLLAPEGSVPDIAENMARVMALSADARVEIARMGRAHVERHFSIDAQVARYTALYERVSGKSAASPRRG